MGILIWAIIAILIGMVSNYTSAVSASDANHYKETSLSRSAVFAVAAFVMVLVAFIFICLGFNILVSLVLKYHPHAKLHMLPHMLISLVATVLLMFWHFQYVFRKSQLELIAEEQAEEALID